MSEASRKMRVGDKAVTDYCDSSSLVEVEIVEVRRGGGSQSGVAFRVSPRLKHCTPDTWFDADWFEPIGS